MPTERMRVVYSKKRKLITGKDKEKRRGKNGKRHREL